MHHKGGRGSASVDKIDWIVRYYVHFLSRKFFVLLGLQTKGDLNEQKGEVI